MSPHEPWRTDPGIADYFAGVRATGGVEYSSGRRGAVQLAVLPRSGQRAAVGQPLSIEEGRRLLRMARFAQGNGGKPPAMSMIELRATQAALDEEMSADATRRAMRR